MTGTDSVSEAVTYDKEAKEIFDDASMNLRSWSSNSAEFLESIPAIDQDDAMVQKCLGLKWDTFDDTWNINPIDVEQCISTKREILKAISRFYDPLGHHSPVVIRAKCLLQDLWRQDIGWDELLHEKFIKQWHEIARDLHLASQVKLPRSLCLSNLSASQELHVFCDASQKAYGALAYLRQSNGDEVNSIMSRTRVAPMKDQTFPRLELMATLVGSRMARFIQQQISQKFDRVCIWTDSTCVLGWIQAST